MDIKKVITNGFIALIMAASAPSLDAPCRTSSLMIPLTNDDGFAAPGLKAAEACASANGYITISPMTGDWSLTAGDVLREIIGNLRTLRR